MLTPLRVALLCSSRAPGVRDLLSDPARGSLYELACVVSTERDFPEREEIVEAGITCVARTRPPQSLELRRKYDADTAFYLKAFDVDLVILTGYRRILTAPMIEAYAGRIVNLHDSDLAVLKQSIHLLATAGTDLRRPFLRATA
jgi:phosphoribosylglycinamide formyltransferase-1